MSVDNLAVRSFEYVYHDLINANMEHQKRVKLLKDLLECLERTSTLKHKQEILNVHEMNALHQTITTSIMFLEQYVS